MIKIYKWNETFETAKTRKLVHLSWLHCPAGIDSAGYIELMARGSDGVLAFGVFLSICQWSATCPPRIRGSLARSDGKPLQVRQLALILRMPADIVENALLLLASHEVGWLVSDVDENVNVLQPSASHLPIICQSSASHLPIIPVQEEEGNGIIQVADAPPPTLDKPLKEKKVFKRPTQSDVESFAIEIGAPEFDAERFMDHYTANGWKAGRVPMSDWKATVRNWIRDDKKKAEQNAAGKTNGHFSAEFLKAYDVFRKYPGGDNIQTRKDKLEPITYEAAKRTTSAEFQRADDSFGKRDVAAIFEKHLADVKREVNG